MSLLLLLAATATGADVAPDPATYGNKWLVMLSAKVERGHIPEGLDRAERTPGVSVVRLDSSSFKNLMPCYELVVAGAFSDVKAARKLGAALAAAGVDHALKNAGAHVGARPELASACAAMREGSTPDTGPVVFGGLTGVPVPVPSAVADRALQHVDTLDATSEESWATPLTAQTIGDWQVGHTVPGGSYERGAETCTITGFSAAAEGTPHCGWREAGLSRPPPCGETRLTADLTCSAEVVAAPGTPLAVGQWTGPWLAGHNPNAWPEANTSIARGQDAATREKPLTATWKQRNASLHNQTVVVHTLQVITGDGEWVCGGGDYMASYVGVTDTTGTPLTPWFETTGAEVRGIFSVQPDQGPTIHTVDIITGSHRALAADGTAHEQTRGYCDCPC